MYDLLTAATELRDYLTRGVSPTTGREHTIPAALSVADLNPPGVLIDPPAVGLEFGGRATSLTWKLTIVAPDTGRGAVLELLGPLLAQLADAIPSWSTAAPGMYDVGGDYGALPGYQIEFTQRLEETP